MGESHRFMKRLLQYLFLFWFGGSIYLEIELLYRGYSFWTMFTLGGIIFLLCGALNEIWSWSLNLPWQVLIGTGITTLLEFIVGVICNIWLGLNMWDYSNLPGNILGQIAPQFIVLWVPLILIAIVVDDVIKWKFFHEEAPKYWIGNKLIEFK